MYVDCIMCGRCDPDGCTCSFGYEYAIKQKLGKEVHERLKNAERRANEAEFQARTAKERQQQIEWKLSCVKGALRSSLQNLKEVKLQDINVEFLSRLSKTLERVNAVLSSVK